MSRLAAGQIWAGRPVDDMLNFCRIENIGRFGGGDCSSGGATAPFEHDAQPPLLLCAEMQQSNTAINMFIAA